MQCQPPLLPSRPRPVSPVQRVVQPEEREQPESERLLELFPNAFPITGIKHISDNIVGSVLESLPQLLAPDSVGCCCLHLYFDFLAL